MKLSVKKLSKKSLSLLIALIMVFSALPLTPPISADAATQTMTFTYSSRGYIAGHTASDNRYDKVSTSTPSINICNDGEASNFCAGFWNYNFSSRPSGRITVNTAKVNLNVLKIENGGQQVDVSVYAVGNSLTSTNSVSTAAAALNLCTKKVKIGTFSNSSIGAKELDCKQAITTMLNEGWQYFNLLLVIEDYGASTGGGNGWTDTHVQQPTLSVTLDVVEATTITADDNANSTTNRVKIGDAIYTYESSSAYYNYGKTISTESDWNTPISTTNKISKVECLDDGSLLTVSNDNKLSGTFYDDKFKVSENTNVNATLKFTFSDGKIEYHRVAVKSYPVQNHVSASAERTKNYVWDTVYSTDYTMFLRDSTGSGGSGVWKYEKTYYTSGTKGHGFPDKNYYASDKKAMSFKWNGGGEAKTDVSKATYFIDKSCRNTAWATLGNSELWDGKNYAITVDVVRTKFNYDNDSQWINILQMVPTNNYTYDKGNASNTNGTTYTLKYTYNQSVSESNRYSPSNTSDNECNLRFALRTTDKGHAVLRTNMVVNLFDKSAARNLYRDYLNENKVSDSYTADSFAAYQNALLDMEAYLSNYENTTNANTSQSVYTNLVNAHDNLKARSYTVTFYNQYGEQVDTRTVKPGSTISSLPNVTDPYFDSMTCTSGVNHLEFKWCVANGAVATNTEFTTSTVINADMKVKEKPYLVSCTYDSNTATCQTKAKCSVCGTDCGSLKEHSYKLETNYQVPIEFEDNMYKRSMCIYNCGTEDINGREYMDVSTYWETYNAQLTQSQDKIENTAKYTSDSIKAVQDIIDEVAPVKDSPTKSQGYIQAKTNALATATNSLVLNKYEITFNVFDEYGNSTETVINAQSCDYGTLLNLQLPDTYQENAVSAWKRNINGADSVVGATSHSLQVMITGDATYTAFVKKATTASEDQAVITLSNKSNKVYDIGYVTISNSVPVTVDVENGTITVGGQELKAPTYSFYKVKGFKINDNTVNTGTINITGDIVIKPEYEAITSFEIKGGDGVVEKSTTTSWDKRVKLTAQTPAQAGKINKWTSTINGKNVVWGYGDTLSFQATQACTVECTEVDAAEFDGAEDVKLSVDYVSYNLYRSNSITAISRVIAPEGIVEEYGTILKTANVKSGATNDNYETQKAAVKNKDNYKVTNKSGVFKSTQMISNTNQFAYNFYSAQNYDKMYVGAVAYAKLTDGSYVYSDVVTYEFK